MSYRDEEQEFEEGGFFLRATGSCNNGRPKRLRGYEEGSRDKAEIAVRLFLLEAKASGKLRHAPGGPFLLSYHYYCIQAYIRSVMRCLMSAYATNDLQVCALEVIARSSHLPEAISSPATEKSEHEKSLIHCLDRVGVFATEELQKKRFSWRKIMSSK